MSSELVVSAAAAHVGVTRQTIFKAIKDGKLAATQNRKGHLQVSLAELTREYGESNPAKLEAQNSRAPRQSPVTPAGAAGHGLELELERVKAQLAIKVLEVEQLALRLAEHKEMERAAREERMRLMALIERQAPGCSSPCAN